MTMHETPDVIIFNSPPAADLVDIPLLGKPPDINFPQVTFPTRRSQDSECTPVAVAFQTIFTIPDYSMFYGTPGQQSTLTYELLADGSLIAPALAQELPTAGGNLVLIGVFLLVAVRNASVSASFIWRIKVKKKGLFNTLFASQFLGLVMLVFRLISTFNQSVNCQTAGRVFETLDGTSSGLIMFGIFSIKAYRVLNNSRIVLAVMILIQASTTALITVDTFVIANTVRTVSGACVRSNGFGLLAAVLIIVFFQACTVLVCLCLAVYKSSRLLAAQGRLSYRLSSAQDLDTQNSPPQPNDASDSAGGVLTQRPRGWWDYVPPPTKPESSALPGITHSSLNARSSGFFAAMTALFKEPSPSLNGELLPQRMQSRSRSMSNVAPPPVATPSRSNNIKPRVLLFREVMRDELCYTTAVAAAWVISAIMGIVGIAHPLFIDNENWLALNWAIISLLAVHSLGRAVTRNEQEAAFRDPRLWDPILLPEREFVSRRPNGPGELSLRSNNSSRMEESTGSGRTGSHHGRGSSGTSVRTAMTSRSAKILEDIRKMAEKRTAGGSHRESGQSWNSTEGILRHAQGDGADKSNVDDGTRPLSDANDTAYPTPYPG